MKTAIVIPARYSSTRFPGKPLAKIGGRTMLSRVIDIARAAAAHHKNADVMVATEDAGIAAHAQEIGAACIMTSANCRTGSDRVLEAVRKSDTHYDFIVNLQGDAPFTPPGAISALIDVWTADPAIGVVTPAHRLGWAELDALREAKKTTPFSGTTVTVDGAGRALWFSKAIIPAIRREDRREKKSPVLQHIGLYGFARAALEQFRALPEGFYERLEGLEQLRLLENGIPVRVVAVEIEGGFLHAGIDSPEDLERAEKFLALS